MEQRRSGIGYQPALDGVRAVAVAVVLVFHLDVSWMTGGYLGVSVFFTLSGFLITSLLLSEHERSGRVDARAFYVRRVRRLLPASLACLLGVGVLVAVGWVAERSGLRAGVLGALFQVENWVALARNESYADLFRAPSPVDHFWSLSIEEQFYWVWPLTMAFVAGWAARRAGPRAVRGHDDARRRRVVTVLGAAFVVTALSAPLTAWWWSQDAVYFASWTRFAEILAGAVLAALLHGRTAPGTVRHLALPALALVVVLCVVTPAGRGWAYSGGLPLFAVLSALLVLSLQVPGPLRTALSWSPLVWIGRVSYGLYLYHWPVYVVLDGERTGLDGVALAALRLGVTLAVTTVSFYALERPVREARWLPARRQLVSAALGGVAVVALVTVAVVPVGGAAEYYEDDLARATTLPPGDDLAPLVPVATTAPSAPSSSAPATDGATGSTGVTSSTAPTTTERIVPSRPVRMLVIGDSTALATASGLIAWSQVHPELAQVEQIGFGGCGVYVEGERVFDDVWAPIPVDCVRLIDEDAVRRVEQGRPDLAVVVTSFWDATDHRPTGGGPSASPLDPDFFDELVARFRAYNQVLLDAGAPRVAWVLYPFTDYLWEQADEPADDPARHDALHDAIRQAAEGFDGRVRVVDLAGWADATGLSTDREARPDGVHWTEAVTAQVAEDFLGEALVQAAVQP